MPTDRPPLGLMLSVTGRKHDAVDDWQVPLAVLALKGKIQTVYCTFVAWQEWQRASTCAPLTAVKSMCDTLGMEFVLIRKLWPHPDKRYLPPRTHSPVSVPYYVAAMQALERDSMELGGGGNVIDTGFDVEPLRESPAAWMIDPPSISATEHRQIHQAIRSAADFAPRPTYVMPTTSSNPDSYPWAFADLGVERICWKTYYAKYPDEVSINSPVDHPFTLRYPAWMVRLEDDTDTKFSKALIPIEFWNVLHEWSIWLGWFPELQTAIIYPPKRGLNTVQVCRALAELL